MGASYKMEMGMSLWESKTKATTTFNGQETETEQSASICDAASGAMGGVDCDTIRVVRAFAILTAVFGILSVPCVAFGRKSRILRVGAFAAAACLIFAALAVIVAATLEFGEANMDGIGFVLHIIALAVSVLGAIMAICAARAPKEAAKKAQEAPAEEPGAPMKNNAEDVTNAADVAVDLDMTVDVESGRPPVQSVTTTISSAKAKAETAAQA